MTEGTSTPEDPLAVTQDKLTDTLTMSQSEAKEYIARNYPGLLFIPQLPGIREFSFQVYRDGKIEIAVQNNDFAGSYELQEAKDKDFSPFWTLSDTAKRGGYLVAKSIRLTSSSEKQTDIMAHLRTSGIALFIDGVCPQLEVFEKDPSKIGEIDENIRDDVLDGLYNAFGSSGGDHPGKGYILNALPVNRETLSTFAHEIGHQQPISFKYREQATDFLNRSTLTKEQKQNMLDRLSYQDERNCSAYGLLYMKNLYKRLGIQAKLGNTLPHLVNAALYVKQSFFQPSSFTEKLKPPPLPKTEDQTRESRIASTIKSLVPSLN